MRSAQEHPDVVDSYLRSELAAGRLLGPLDPSLVPSLHVNRFGVIPKGRTPGKWRLITDLSFPEGASVNDGISAELCSLHYTSVDKVAGVARRLGPGAQLAKVDIKSAYRLVPVHPDDRPLLGVCWHDEHYVDAMLPFGLRSAPKIFTAVADALEWCIRQRGVEDIDHYLDDFIIMAPPASHQCGQALATLEEECAALGVPLAPEKKEGPSTNLTFLGIQIDTESGLLSLPPIKLRRLQQEVSRWMDRSDCQRRELESLIGTLQHAAKVIHPGRSFVRRLIDLLKHFRRARHPIRLNKEHRADLLWWRTFAERWNGVSYFPPPPSIAVEFASDASGSWGCGAWCQSQWWQLRWPEGLERDIAFKELFAVVLAAAVWGRGWCGERVRGHCDSQVATDVLRARSSRNPELMHLLRCLFFIEAEHKFVLSVVHIAGVANDLADDLSRDQLASFLSKVPQASPLPTPIPPPLVELLLDTRGTWTSPAWTQRFIDTVTWA